MIRSVPRNSSVEPPHCNLYISLCLGALVAEFMNNLGIGDVKPIKGRASTYRRRVGAYRIVYSLEYQAHVVKVLKIGTRGDIYK